MELTLPEKLRVRATAGLPVILTLDPASARDLADVIDGRVETFVAEPRAQMADEVMARAEVQKAMAEYSASLRRRSEAQITDHALRWWFLTLGALAAVDFFRALGLLWWLP